MWCDPLKFEERFHRSDEETYLHFAETTTKADNSARLDLLVEHAPAATHRQLLEIGCMHGDFLVQARDRGYEVAGLDLSPSAVSAAYVPESIQLGTLDDAQPDRSVDIVAAFNVVEHMADPDRFLRHVARVLRPGGVFIVETPSQESIYHHVLFLRATVLRRGNLEVGINPGGHMFKYGRRAWRRILEQGPFEVLRTEPRATPIRELLRKKRRTSLGVKAGIVGFGVAARMMRLENRVLVVARSR